MHKVSLIDYRLKIANGVIYWRDKREVDGDVYRREFYVAHEFEAFIRDHFGVKVWDKVKCHLSTKPKEPDARND